MATHSSIGPSPRSGVFLPLFFKRQRQVWLWPHLLSLDAPLVAVLWQVLLMRCLAVPVSRGEPFVLALCVWCVYVCDRVFDAMRPQTAGWEPARKIFYRRHLPFASAAGLCMVSSVLPLAYYLLKRATFQAGLALAVALLSYIAFVQLAPLRWRARWPREMAVAGVFTCGVFLAVWIGNGRSLHRLWGPAVLFALLCWMNCCVIETWEWQRSACYAEEEPSGSTQWAARHLPFLAFGIAALAVLMEHMNLAPPRFSIAAFLSGIALAILAACRRRLPMNGLRVAADLALCTPLPVLLLGFFS